MSSSSAQVLVAVHGNFASARWWADLVAKPPPGWLALAPDLPGFAGTRPLHETSIPAYADWLADWTRRQGINRAVYLGHSLGGAVVLELAHRHPERVSGLVLAASAPLAGLVTPPENYPVLEMLRENAGLLEMSLGALFVTRKPDNFAELLQDAAQMHAEHYSGNARTLEKWHVDPADLPPVPVLVLGGSEDRLVTPDMVRQQAEQLGTQASIFDGLGHGFPQEDPELLRRELGAFLTGIQQTTPK